MTLRVVLSYKHDDANKYAKIISTHFSTLAANHDLKTKFDFFYDKDLESSEKWHQSIEEKFKNADIAVCFISEQYYLSEYIQNHELKLILHKKKSNNRFPIEPIYINKVVNHHPLSEFQSFNKDKPLALQTDEESKDILRMFVESLYHKAQDIRPQYSSSYSFRPPGFLANILSNLQFLRLKKKLAEQTSVSTNNPFGLLELEDLHEPLPVNENRINIVGPPGVGKTFFLTNHIRRIHKQYSNQNLFIISLDEYLINKRSIISSELIWDSIVLEFQKKYSNNLNLLKYILFTKPFIVTLENIHLIENENSAKQIFTFFNDLIYNKLKIPKNNRVFFITSSRNFGDLPIPFQEGTQPFFEKRLFPLEEVTKPNSLNRRTVLEYYYDVIQVNRSIIQHDYNTLDSQKRTIIEDKLFRSQYTRTPLFVNLSIALSKDNEPTNRLEIFSRDLPSLIEAYNTHLIRSIPPPISLQIGQVMPAYYQIATQFISHSVINQAAINNNINILNNLILLHAFNLLTFNQIKNEYRFQHDLIKEYYFIEHCFNSQNYRLIQQQNQTKDCAHFILYFLSKDASNSNSQIATSALNSYLNYSLPASIESIECFLNIVTKHNYSEFIQKFGSNRNGADRTIFNNLTRLLDCNKPDQLNEETIDSFLDFLTVSNNKQNIKSTLINKLRNEDNINLIRIGSRFQDKDVDLLINQILETKFEYYLKYMQYHSDFLTHWIRWTFKNNPLLNAKLIRYLHLNINNDYFYLILDEYRNIEFENLKTIIRNLFAISKDKTYYTDCLPTINCLLINRSNNERIDIMAFISENFKSKGVLDSKEHLFLFVPSGKLQNDLSAEKYFNEPFLVVFNIFKVRFIRPNVKVSSTKISTSLEPAYNHLSYTSELDLSFLLEISKLSVYNHIRYSVLCNFQQGDPIYLLLRDKFDTLVYRLLTTNYVPTQGNNLNYSRYLVRNIEEVEFSETNPLLYMPYKTLKK